jgi:hypothetical protein
MPKGERWAHPRNSDWTEGREQAHREANGIANMQIARARHKARLVPPPTPEATMIEELKALLNNAVLAAFDSTADCDVGLVELRESVADIEWPQEVLSVLSAVPVMKEALGGAYKTLSTIADAADEDQVKLAAREAMAQIDQALAALEGK